MNRRSFLSKLAFFPLAVPAALHAARLRPVAARSPMTIIRTTPGRNFFWDARGRRVSVLSYGPVDLDRARVSWNAVQMATDKTFAAMVRLEHEFARLGRLYAEC